MKKFLNKKAEETSSGFGTAGNIFLVLLVLFLIGFGLTKTFAKQNAATNSDCGKSYDGFCAESVFKCGDNYEPEVLGKCDTGLVCCKPKNLGTTPVDEVCKGKVAGDQCGETSNNTVCNQKQKCVYKCEYCATFPNSPTCNNLKNSKGITIEFNNNFACKCSRAECDQREGSGECIKGLCGATTPNYCCE